MKHPKVLGLAPPPQRILSSMWLPLQTSILPVGAVLLFVPCHLALTQLVPDTGSARGVSDLDVSDQAGMLLSHQPLQCKNPKLWPF